MYAAPAAAKSTCVAVCVARSREQRGAGRAATGAASSCSSRGTAARATTAPAPARGVAGRRRDAGRRTRPRRRPRRSRARRASPGGRARRRGRRACAASRRATRRRRARRAPSCAEVAAEPRLRILDQPCAASVTRSRVSSSSSSFASTSPSLTAAAIDPLLEVARVEGEAEAEELDDVLVAGGVVRAGVGRVGHVESG